MCRVACQLFLRCTVELLRHQYFFFLLLFLVPTSWKLIFLRRGAFYSLGDIYMNKQTFLFRIPGCYPKGIYLHSLNGVWPLDVETMQVPLAHSAVENPSGSFRNVLRIPQMKKEYTLVWSQFTAAVFLFFLFLRSSSLSSSLPPFLPPSVSPSLLPFLSALPISCIFGYL